MVAAVQNPIGVTRCQVCQLSAEAKADSDSDKRASASKHSTTTQPPESKAVHSSDAPVWPMYFTDDRQLFAFAKQCFAFVFGALVAVAIHGLFASCPACDCLCQSAPSMVTKPSGDDHGRSATCSSGEYHRANHGFYCIIPQEVAAPATLLPGFALRSPNRKFYAAMQPDGNFVLYASADFRPNSSTWSTDTWRGGHHDSWLQLHESGRMELVRRKGNSKETPWSSRYYCGDGRWLATPGGDAVRLVLLDDGTLSLVKRTPSGGDSRLCYLKR